MAISCAGYAAIFHHPKDELNYCVYIIPGNPKVTPDDLPYWHNQLKKSDPYMSKALGPNIKIERMRAGENLRLFFVLPHLRVCTEVS